nr:e3 ubiquitin-protein ligase dma1 [Quercus suber]
MLGSAVSVSPTSNPTTNPSTAHPVASTSSTSSSSSRPSRLRSLSYLRSYTQNHLPLLSANTTAPALLRSPSFPEPSSPRPHWRPQHAGADGITVQTGDGGWLPTVRGRPALERKTLQPTPTDAALEVREPDMIRTRAATNLAPDAAPTPARRSSAADLGLSRREVARDMSDPSSSGQTKERQPTIKFIPHVEARSARPSLHFTASSHKLEDAHSIVRVGRYSERDAASPGVNIIPVGFKSKVVSRRHCEFWCTNGQWFVKDVKSSSGTFLNHVRLSSPGSESRPFPVNDGDVVQLGIDFKGGEEVIFRCVKIRIECNRGWQKSLNAYNTTAHKRLMKNAVGKKSRDSDVTSINTSECSICLNAVAPCQPLFVAPCSHVWHYKCIKNLLMGPHYPNFLCPNCRFVADLEADVEPPEEFEDAEPEERIPELDAHGSDLVDENGHDGTGPIDDETDELADLLHETNLHSSTQPMSILRPQNRSNAPTPTLDGARSTTPTSSTPFALASPSQTVPEGPMTPRNDAGPFVFDGNAGRADAAIRARDSVSDEFLHER